MVDDLEEDTAWCPSLVVLPGRMEEPGTETDGDRGSRSFGYGSGKSIALGAARLVRGEICLDVDVTVSLRIRQHPI